MYNDHIITKQTLFGNLEILLGHQIKGQLVSIFLIGLAVYLVWLGIGIWYFLYNLGNKMRKEPWYVWIIMLPIWTILPIFRFITYLLELKDDKFTRK